MSLLDKAVKKGVSTVFPGVSTNNISAPSKKKGVKTSNTTAKILKFDDAYPNGMIRKGNEYSIVYELPNVSFRGLSKQAQKEINEDYITILNSFDNFLKITLVIANIRENMDLFSKVRYSTEQYPVYAAELNNMMSKCLANKSTINTHKFFVIKGTFETPMEADNQFRQICNNLDELLSTAFQIKGEILGIGKRSYYISVILNRDNYNPYLDYNQENDDYELKLDLLEKQRLSLSDIIKPDYFEIHLDHFELNEREGKSYYLQKIGSNLNTDFLYSLYSIDAEMIITVEMNGIESGDAIKKLNNKYSSILSEIDQKDGFQTLEQVSEQDNIMEMQNSILNEDEKAYYSVTTLTLFADKDKLENLQTQVYNKAKRYTCAFAPLYTQQEYGLMTCCLLGFYDIEYKRFMTAHSLSAFMPFDVPEYFDAAGIYYGLHKLSNQAIFYNRKKNTNYNALVLGSSGSGKSFFVKKDILLTRLKNPKDNFYIIDPDGEYTLLCEKLGGQVIDLRPGNGVYINPLDLDIDTSQDKNVNPITAKSDFIASLVETMMGGIVLNAKAKSILDRCVIQIYKPYLEHLETLTPDNNGRKKTIDRTACPTLQDLYDKLLMQPQVEAQEIAISIETYITGSFDTFAHRSNVDTANNFIVYNIQGLGTNMMDLGLRICMSEVWNRMIENRAKNIWTRLYIDEFHNLLTTDLSAQFCKKVWKQARKWMGMTTGITQNTEDLLLTPEARAIINNSGLIVLLRQSEMDQEILKDILKLDQSDIKYINKVKPGSGLIVTDADTVPFYDDFPEDTECYVLLNTSPNEEEEKRMA